MARPKRATKKTTKNEEYAAIPIATKNDFGGVSIFEPMTTDSGSLIDEDKALRISTVWACQRLITEGVAVLPRHVYNRLPKGREIYRDHPTYTLLHDAPNDYMTAFEFFETLTSHVSLWGNGYAYIDRSDDGVPVSLQPLLPDRTEPELRNGNLIYKTRLNGITAEFLPKDILHFKGLGFDGLVGYSPIRMMRQDLGADKSAGEFQGKFYASGSNMGGVMSAKGKLSPEAKSRLRDQIKSEYQGNSNAFKLMVLEEGMDFEKFGVSPEDGQLNETRKLLIRKIAASFKVPSHKVGGDVTTSYNSLEQENKSFNTECINPYLRRFEDQINMKLYTEAERGQVYFEFNRMGFLQADLSVQTQHFHLMLQDKVYVPNEIREFYGMNPIPSGDVPYTNVAPAAPIATSPTNEGTESTEGESN